MPQEWQYSFIHNISPLASPKLTYSRKYDERVDAYCLGSILFRFCSSDGEGWDIPRDWVDRCFGEDLGVLDEMGASIARTSA